MPPLIESSLSRRLFLGTSASLAGAAILGAPAILRGASEDKLIKIGLIGCGGRGTGAASQALKADRNIQLVAMGDIVPDQIEKSLSNLRASFAGDPAKIAAEVQKFSGLDAVDKVLAQDVDVVLLTTPPGFRAEHFEKAVQAGKHAFVEKPVAVDGPTFRRFMAAARLSKEKNLAVQSGFCWRSHFAERETQAKVHAGEIGDVRVTFGTYLTSTPWVKPRLPGWTDLEWQLRNWAYFTWLSGDLIVEQAVHNVDKMCWTFNDMDPIAAFGTGGRQQRVEAQYGQSWDNFSVTYEFPNGARGQISARQQAGCYSEVRDAYYGTKGQVEQTSGSSNTLRDASGAVVWKYKGPKNDMYQTEHDEFFASLRSGQHMNHAALVAHSSMVAVMGRMACYTGQRVTWEDAIASKQELRPAAELQWDMPLEVPPVAIPGRTKFM